MLCVFQTDFVLFNWLRVFHQFILHFLQLWDLAFSFLCILIKIQIDLSVPTWLTASWNILVFLFPLHHIFYCLLISILGFWVKPIINFLITSDFQSYFIWKFIYFRLMISDIKTFILLFHCFYLILSPLVIAHLVIEELFYIPFWAALILSCLTSWWLKSTFLHFYKFFLLSYFLSGLWLSNFEFITSFFKTRR